MGNVTINNVELLKTGTWSASTGEVTITRTDLEDILAAWDSKRLPLAVIKIGHTDPRMENPEWDGEPAYGQVDELRIIDNDDDTSTLAGDYINVPEELADKLPSAYPQRSVEIDWQVELRDEDNEVVESYPAVLTAVALLGATPPAVKGLADVHAQFKKRKSSLSVHHAGGSTRLTTGPTRMAYPGGHTADSLRDALIDALQEATSGVEFIFVEDFDDEQVWYSAETLTEGSGYTFHTYQRTYEASDNGVLTLTGEPVRVQARRTFQPIPEADNPGTGTVPHDTTQTADGSPVDAHQTAASSRPDEGEPMEFTDEQLKVLREKFGLSEDATNDDVLEALNNAADAEDENPEAPEDGAAAEDHEDDDEDAAADAENEVREPVAASQDEGEPATVTLSQASFADMQATIKRQGAQLSQITAERAKERRDKTLQVALSDGRIHPNDADHWRKELDRDEKGTTTTLSRLTPVIPTSEVGTDNAAYFMDADTEVNKQMAELDDQYFGKKGA